MPGTDARELLAVREIAHAFLLAEHPRDVQQFALDRVTPLIGAAFSLVMELGPDGALLRPVAQHEWPAPHRPWIGALRVRVGDGPSGLAVAERRLVEVADLFAEPALSAWHEVATELGFRSIIAAPLETAAGPIGAVAFYFTDTTRVSDEQRALVRLVADQLAAATDKARQTDALRRANGALAEANAELEAQASAWSAAERARAASEGIVVDALLALTAPDDLRTPGERLDGVRALAAAAHEFAAVSAPGLAVVEADVDPRGPLQAAAARWRARAPMVPIQVDEPTVLLPTMRVDEARLTRALDLVLGLGVCGGAVEGGLVRAGVRVERGFLALTVNWRGRPVLETDAPGAVDGRHQPPSDTRRILRVRPEALHWDPSDPFAPARRAVTAIDPLLARALTSRLGGDFRVETGTEGGDAEQECRLVFPVDVDRD
jgi:GAF domain-containing protein